MREWWTRFWALRWGYKGPIIAIVLMLLYATIVDALN